MLTKKTRISLSTLTFIYLIFSGCIKNTMWFSPPDQNIKLSPGWEKVEFCKVEEKYVDNYIEYLKDKEFFPVERDVVKILCANEMSPEIQGQAYIIRSLYIGKYSGNYAVKTKNNIVWVNHESLAHKSVKISKSAIVVILKDKPSRIYVTAYADE